jgi:hypothetical protein
MSDILQLTKENIQARSVDLDELQALIQYLAVGLSFQSSFELLKHSNRSKISKAQATRLRSEFLTLVGGKPKTYLRARLPLFMIGLVQYSTQAILNQPVVTRIDTFKSLLSGFDSNSLSSNVLQTLKAACSQGLSLPYYTSKLNSTLDPVSSFFNGQTPNSFSNSLAEFVSLLDQRLQADRPERDQAEPPSIKVVEEPEREIRLLPRDEAEEPSVTEVLPPNTDTPTIQIVDTHREPKAPLPPKPSSSNVASGYGSAEEEEFLKKYKPWFIGGACLVALTTAVILVRR